MQIFVYEILCFLFKLIGASNPLGKARMQIKDQTYVIGSPSLKSQLPTLGLQRSLFRKISSSKIDFEIWVEASVLQTSCIHTRVQLCFERYRILTPYTRSNGW
jgi:hypothetical protein